MGVLTVAEVVMVVLIVAMTVITAVAPVAALLTGGTMILLCWIERLASG